MIAARWLRGWWEERREHRGLGLLVDVLLVRLDEFDRCHGRVLPGKAVNSGYVLVASAGMQ